MLTIECAKDLEYDSSETDYEDSDPFDIAGDLEDLGAPAATISNKYT